MFHNPSVCKIVLNKHLDVKTEGNLLKEGHFGQFYPAIGGTSSRLGHEIVKKWSTVRKGARGALPIRPMNYLRLEGRGQIFFQDSIQNKGGHP